MVCVASKPCLPFANGLAQGDYAVAYFLINQELQTEMEARHNFWQLWSYHAL